MFKTGDFFVIFRKQEELVYIRTHMCYSKMDNIENVHGKKILFII